MVVKNLEKDELAIEPEHNDIVESTSFNTKSDFSPPFKN